MPQSNLHQQPCLSFFGKKQAHSLDWIMYRSGHFHPLHGPPGDTVALQLAPLEATDVVFVVPLVDGRERSSDQFHTAAAAGLSGSAFGPAGILGRHHGADHGVRETCGLDTQQPAAAELGGEDDGVLTAAVAIAVGIGTCCCCCAICLDVIAFGFVRGSTGSLYRRRTEEDMHRCISIILNIAGEEVALGGRAHGCLLVLGDAAILCWF